MGRLINNGTAAVFAVPSVVAGDNPTGTSAAAYNAALCNLSAVKAQNLVPSAGNVPLRSVPYDQRQNNASISADYRVARAQNLNVQIERETIDRAHRERDQTRDDKIKLGYVNRALPSGTLRITLEQGRRRGSTYNADPYQDFYSISLGPLPKANGTALNNWLHMNDLLRRFDLADRDQTVLNLRFNQALKDDLDLSLSAQSKELRYPDSAYGRNGQQRLTSLNAELNWQPAVATNVYGFVSQQDGRMNQAAIQQNACTLGTTYFFYSDGSVATTATPTAAQVAAGITVVANSGVVTSANFVGLCGRPSATSPLYPTSRTWTATQADSSTALGIGVKHDFGRARLDVNVSATRSRTATAYTYNAAALGLVTSGAATPAQLAALALIGNGFPDLIFKQSVLDASLLVPVNKTVAVRLLARVESGKFRDWHYDGVAANPTPANNQQTYLDAGPQDYRTYMVGALMQISW